MADVVGQWQSGGGSHLRLGPAIASELAALVRTPSGSLALPPVDPPGLHSQQRPTVQPRRPPITRVAPHGSLR